MPNEEEMVDGGESGGEGRGARATGSAVPHQLRRIGVVGRGGAEHGGQSEETRGRSARVDPLRSSCNDEGE